MESRLLDPSMPSAGERNEVIRGVDSALTLFGLDFTTPPFTREDTEHFFLFEEIKITLDFGFWI